MPIHIMALFTDICPSPFLQGFLLRNYTPEAGPRNPATRHAICEDYRAAAGIDMVHDADDSDRKVQALLLALWGAQGTVGKLYDVLETWREKALDVQGEALD